MTYSILRNNNAQLSIFILVALIVVVLLVALFAFSFSDEREIIENSQIISQSGLDNLLPIKDHIDLCLEKQTRRALIISGLRGGFIYDDGEYYGPSVIPEDTYRSDFISNQELNWNNLLFATLIHSQTQVYSPQLYTKLIFSDGVDDVIIYNKSIQDDMETFIGEQLLRCIAFEELQERGFDISFDSFSGPIQSFDQASGRITVTDLEGEVGDLVFINYEGDRIVGQVLSTSDDEVVLLFNPLDLQGAIFDEELSEIEIYNSELELNVSVEYTEEEVITSVDFPVIIDAQDSSLSFETSVVTLPVRYERILELASILANEKYRNKSLDYSEEDDFLLVLNKYYDADDEFLDSISLVKTIINNSDIRKEYVYSLVDENSLLLGNPFVFNFGYENDAPEFNLSSLGAEGVFGEGVLLLTAKNTPVTIDLKPLTSDSQIRDNFVSEYVPQVYNGPDASFSVTSEGELFFTGFQEKKFTFEVSVTDRETLRSQPFTFITGLPDNTGNRLAEQCFTFFDSAEVPGVFPVEEEFKDVINFNNNGTYVEAYAYMLYLDSVLSTQYGIAGSILNFAPSCLYSPTLFQADVTINGVPASVYNPSTGDIFIPFSPMIQEVGVSVKDISTAALATEPYRITIYPASCLGPHPDTNATTVAQYGGDQSCCNTAPIVSSLTSNSPQAFLSPGVLETSGDSFNTEAYFCYDLLQLTSDPARSGYVAAYETKNIWTEIGPQATSLFEGNIRAVCDGSSAVGKLSSIDSPSPDFTGITSQVGYYGSVSSDSIPFSLSRVEGSGTCEFCYITDHAPFELYLGTDYLLLSGIKSQNPADLASVAPLPYNVGPRTFSDVYVMCDANWYGSNTGFNDPTEWSISFFGLTGVPETIHRSQGYCYQESTVCSGKPFSPTYSVRFDNNPVCSDWYLDSSSGDLLTQPNTGWVCGVNMTCSSGICT